MSIDLMADFWIGIISGLVATGMILMIQFLWIRGFIPWFEERIYKDAHIEGKWEGKIRYPDHDGETLVLEISRKSHTINGKMMADGRKEFRVNGEFRNMILTLTYSSVIPSAVDRGCFSFLLKENGRLLEGGAVIYYSPDHKIAAASISLYREDQKRDQSSTPNSVAAQT